MSISAKVICDSLSPAGVRLTTLELSYHRFIHAEFMTHRMFSRNASSSRAIPIEKMITSVESSPAIPIYWGKNQPGMQAKEEISGTVNRYMETEDGIEYPMGAIEAAILEWECLAYQASHNAMTLYKDFNLHKQIVNRLLEPFQYIKVIVTATEWENFFKLRLHKDAQPEMMVLAEHMQKAMLKSEPTLLHPGEWHLPYVEYEEFLSENECYVEMDKAIKCSVARCARVSYMNHDNSTPNIDKDIALADMLLEAGHMSPFEHQGTPMNFKHYQQWYDLKGVTHQDRDAWHWSGNFKGWLQHRQLISAI